MKFFTKKFVIHLFSGGGGGAVPPGYTPVIVRDISSLNPETATIHCLVTLLVHLQCKGQRLSLILARSYVKYLTLGKSPSDDNAFSLPVFEGWFRLFCLDRDSL